MSKSRRPEFGLPPGPKNHVRKGRAAKQRRQEAAQARRDAHPNLYQDMK